MKNKLIILGILLFFIFYLEPLSFGAMKFAHLWKIVLLFYMIISTRFAIKKDNITKYSFFYYSKYILTTGIFYYGYFVDGFLMFVRGLSIPVINNFLNVKKYSSTDLIRALKFISNFVIFSSIPFLLDIIQPISSGYSLEQYGSTVNGYVGIFQNPHGAAIITSQALIINLFFAIKNRRIKIFDILVIALGFFVLYKTYVRTGYVMFFIGFFFVAYFEYGIRRIYKLIPVIGLLGFATFYLYNNDNVLQRRIAQRNIYQHSGNSTIDKVSSGRITLTMVNLKNYSESDLLTKLVWNG